MTHIRPLVWDSEAFGFTVARIENIDDPAAQLPVVQAQLIADGIALAYWEAPHGDEPSRLAALRNGSELINSRVLLDIGLTGQAASEPRTIVDPDPAQRCVLDELALASGWSSRFALDPRFPRPVFERLYRTWMENSLNGSFADAVIVAGEGDAIDGMVTVSAKGGQGQIGLFGVAATARGKGVGKKLLREALGWFAREGCARASVVTQGENEVALAIYQSCGFAISAHSDVFHFWNQQS